MQMSIQQKNQILPAGYCRGTYKPKDENIKKLKVYLNKLEDAK
jgi:hypothetical protein